MNINLSKTSIMKKNIIFIFAAFIALCSSLKSQPAGTLDLTFNATGKVVYDKDKTDLYQDVKVQPDGKIVAVGTSYTPTYSSVIEVTRYLADGSFDPAFGTGGHFNYSMGVETGAYKCIIKENGKILICGYTTDYATYGLLILQLNEEGTPDPDFGSNGVVVAETSPAEKNAYAMALQDDNKILLAGYSVNSDYRNAPMVLRFTESGVLDTSFGTDGIATIPITEIDNDFSAVSVQSDGKIIAAGHISNGLSWFSLLVARFDDNGQLDPTYGTGGVINLNLGNVDDEFFDMQLTSDDEAILAGFTVSQSDLYYHLLLMKFDASGYPVLSFGLDGYTIYGDVPYTFGDALVLQPDGKILVAGCTGDLTPANNDWAVWRFNSDGNLDNSFGTSGIVTTDFFGKSDEALGIALHADKIVVAGKTRNATDYLDFAVARYMNDVNVAVSEGENPVNFSVSPNPVKYNGEVNVIFELKQPDNISIEVLNITGSTIMIKPFGIQAAGEHSFRINLPASVSSGVYFVRITVSKVANQTRKLIVTE
jgi:uncharacterized delta-60 repeat protein